MPSCQAHRVDDDNVRVTTPRAQPSTPGGHVLVGAAIVLLALNLRLAVGSVGVVLDALRTDLGMSVSVAGALTTLPVLCFSIFGGGSHGLIRRLGLHHTAAAVLVVTAFGLVLRALVDSTPAFLVLSVVALAGSAVGNVMLPTLAKVHFPDQLPMISALYGAALMGGSALGPLLTVPIAEAYGGWRMGIGSWSLLAVVALLPWLRFLGRDVHVDPTATRMKMGELTRSPLAWATVACFGAQSAQAYAQFGWFPAILQDAGLSDGYAGAMQGLLSAIGIPVTLALPILMAWVGDRPVLPWMFTVLVVIGWSGVLLWPTEAPWLWATLMGVGGGAFTWTLAMMGERTRTPDATAALSGFVQGIGYMVAGIGPFGVGLLHDRTGSWTAPVIALMLIAAVIGIAGTVISRPVMLEDTLGARR